MLDEEGPYIDPDPTPTIAVPSRKTLLILLGGMGAAAVLLYVLRRAMEAKLAAPTVETSLVPDLGQSWETSLRHVADVFDVRTDAMRERIEALDDLTKRIPPSILMPPPGTETPDTPIPPVVTMSNAPVSPNGNHEAVDIAGTPLGSDSPPPGPAAVSQ